MIRTASFFFRVRSERVILRRSAVAARWLATTAKCPLWIASMSTRFRLLTESDVKAVLSMDDLIETMAAALQRFSTGGVVQPVRSVIGVGEHAFFGVMPALVRADGTASAAPYGAITSTADDGSSNHQTSGVTRERRASMGAKLVTVFEGNTARDLPTHLASIVLLDPETGALLALLDGRFITEARTAAVSAVTSRLLARTTAKSLAIIGSGVQARSHLDALSRVHRLSHVSVWSPNKAHRDQFVKEAQGHTEAGARGFAVSAVDHAGEAIVGADLIVLATSSTAPVVESGWVKPGAHVMSVGACRPTQREMDPALVARARLFVDSRAAALVESGDVVLGIQEARFGPDHVAGEIGEVLAGRVEGRRGDSDITVFKSLGLAVEDVTAADLAYRRAVERGIGVELTLN